MRGLISGLVLGAIVLTTLNAAELEYSRTDKRDGIYIVDLSILVEVPEIYARDVLMDPDRFKQLNSTILEIEHLPEKSPGIRRFRDKTSACVLFFCVTYQNIMQLVVLENGDIEINVEPEGSDFEYGHVVWHTEPLGETYSRLSLHAESKPSFWMPPGLGISILAWQMEGVVYDVMSNMECEYQGKQECSDDDLLTDEEEL